MLRPLLKVIHKEEIIKKYIYGGLCTSSNNDACTQPRVLCA